MKKLMPKAIFLLLLVLIVGCAKEEEDEDTAAASTVPNVMSKAGGVLPSPGTASFTGKAVTQPSCSDWGTSNSTRPDWFRKGWVGYSVFSLLADTSTWDPTTDCWGVENMRNNLNIMSALWSELTQSGVGAGSGTILGLAYTSDISEISTGSFTYSAALAPQVDVSSLTYTNRRTVELTLTDSSDVMNFEIAWSYSSGVVNAVIGMYNGADGSSGELTIMTASYDTSTKDISVIRSTLTGGGGSFHMKIAGNETTSVFTVDYHATETSTSKVAYVTGKADDAADSHFVVRMRQNLSGADPSTGDDIYLCVNSGVTDANFATLFNSNGANNFGDSNGLYGDEVNIADTIAVDGDTDTTLDLGGDYAACNSGSYATAAEGATLLNSTYVSTTRGDYLPTSIVP
jgi:hypothetical protein